ncbi:MAG: tRNA-dihydrouridine synthase [Clostridia bacterium]|nr:tRNA-dihydrouridine synthase [Clostridia bacterium]
MKCGDIEIGNILLAPMAGVSEVGFREVCKLAGADLTCTEMVNAVALNHDSAKTKDLLITSSLENVKSVQIFGHDALEMAKAVTNSCLSKFDIIDINFGCPAPKIVNNGDGSALLKDVNKIYKIVSACKNSTNKPISCKFRKGFGAGDNVSKDVARACEDAGASMLTIHGRTRAQMYSGVVDLEAIACVKSVVKIPVIGNGDITDFNSYNKMLSTGVDGVMIGRGALGNPNIFASLKNKAPIDKMELIERHIRVLREFFDERFVSATMRKHLLWYIAGEPNVNKIKLDVATKDLNQAIEIVRSFLSNNG